MSRYIDVSKINYYLRNVEVGHGIYQDRIIAFESDIDKIPAADVVEANCGYWKKVSEKYPRYCCTVCNHLFNNKGYKYCPNCGAKMNIARDLMNGT